MKIGNKDLLLAGLNPGSYLNVFLPANGAYISAPVIVNFYAVIIGIGNIKVILINFQVGRVVEAVIVVAFFANDKSGIAGVNYYPVVEEIGHGYHATSQSYPSRGIQGVGNGYFI